tara:strand:+ start:31812 stop:32783 length:972 start_codon:yes stop_codon:yes gene_type:complete
MRVFLVFASLLLGQALMHSVHAQTPASVRLDYQRDASASSCPEKGATRDAVAARLGRRPFSNDAPRTIYVRLTASGTGFSVDITVENESGAIEGSRTLHTEHSDCGELAAAMQLALAIAVDPMHGSAFASEVPAPVPSPQPAAVVAPAPSLLPQPSLAAEPRRQHFVGVGAGLGVGSGAMPSLAATVHYQRRTPTAMWSLEARGELPTEHSTPPGKIRTTHLSAALLACLPKGAWDFCAMGRLGIFRASGSNFEESLSAQTPYGALGPRLGWNYGLSDASRIEVVGEVLARVTNTELTVDERVVWESSAFEMALGARYVWELL